MSTLRKEFWTKSYDHIEWCEDNELLVLRAMTNKEMERRIDTFSKKLDASDARRTKAKKNQIRKRARGLK